MHSPSQLVLYRSERRAHAVPPALPLELEVALAGLAADEREAQEVEGLRFAEPTMIARDRSEAAKLDQAGLFRMQRQRERCQTRVHRLPEVSGIGFLLEIARGLVPSPACGPKVEHVMQVDVGKQRRGHRTLPCPLITDRDDLVLQDTRLQP